MYINDLADGLNSTVRLFADDTSLYRTICCDASDLQNEPYTIGSLAAKMEDGIQYFKE